MSKEKIVLTRRGEKLMLAVFWLSLVLIFTFAEDLTKVLN